MRSRRDQVQAYRFQTRRIGSALLAGEPETNELPMRRYGIAVLGSILIGAVVFAGFGVWGLVSPGGKRPPRDTIILERETGAKYVYLAGLLHPVLNWTSARLILGQEKPATRTMAQASLRDVPRGRPVGIPGVPDALPVASALLGPPWSVCSAPRSAASVVPAAHVLAGSVPAGGTPLGAEGLLVSVDERRYLLWEDRRLRVRDNAVLAALGWTAIRPVPVGEAFVNAVPAGPDLTGLAVPDAGSPARVQIAGRAALVGQFFRAAGQHYVLLSDGLAPVGAVSAALAAAEGRSVVELPAQEVGRVLLSTTVEPPGFPDRVPSARGADGRAAMVCAAYPGTSPVERPVRIQTFGTATLDAGDAPPPGVGADGVRSADRVTLPGGRAALVVAQAAPGATAPSTVFLVTDQGIKYPLPQDKADQVRGALGYKGSRPVPVPAAILALVPTGAALDPEAAVLLQNPPAVNPSASRGVN
ncbi:type VII secretion protein EccB [Virgisporangium aliadipatigenens]|uniref:Type VII secretion protein EccB n=1 Tax=Virgisporangium aliadipatigenens TaxID=741659 RepID=A0A8J3YRF6_9ACTN|nr:type VII secretion protein EccB [Virgisporangium aliadipatigenens]GIJ49008.1 type VII secretion protein EccB [Virgisporangium aliadipatigenens]